MNFKLSSYFDLKKFGIAYFIWFIGFVFSLLPLAFSYLFYIEPYKNESELGIFTYILNQPDILYCFVSITIVAFADILIDITSGEKATLKTVKTVIILLQMVIIVTDTLAYSVFKYSDTDFSFVLGDINFAMLIVSFLINTISYICKYVKEE